jgi:Zn finger protein HypA/HybF involved in hydrogenase expression
MRRLSKELIDKIRTCRDKGWTQKRTAEILQIKNLAGICGNYNIRGWPIGAAARDQTGEKNPAFKGGTSRSTMRRRTKEALIYVERDLFLCERCGLRKNTELPRHHKDRDKTNNSPDNIEVLCPTCHSKEHISEFSRNNLGRLQCKDV